MNRFLKTTLVACLMAMTLLSRLSVAEGEIDIKIPNSGFENGLAGWQTSGAVGIDPAKPLEGKNSVRIGPGAGVVWQRIAIGGGKAFKVGALIKSDPTTAGLFNIRFLDKDGRMLMELRSDSDLKSAKQGQTSRGYYFKTHPLTTAIEIVIAKKGAAPGVVIADKVTFAKYEKEEPPPAPTCDLDQYLLPFWHGRTVYNETVLMLSEDGKPATGRLMFTPTSIVSVRDYTLTTTFNAGMDYTLRGRVLTCTPGSRMTQVKDSDFVKGELKWFNIGGKAVVVTYEHEDAWRGPTPGYVGDRMPNTMKKLAALGPLTVVAYGDSITDGTNVSRKMGQAPWMPTWAELFTHRLKTLYHDDAIRVYNSALGGVSSDWGRQYASRMVASLDPDLVIVAFGMNDFWGTPPKKYKANINAIIEAVRARKPDAEFLLIAPMRFDPAYTAKESYRKLLGQYAGELQSLCGQGVQMLDMTAISEALYTAKKPKDCVPDPLHPNDFMARWYAQGLAALLDKNEPRAEPVSVTTTPSFTPAATPGSVNMPAAVYSSKKGVGHHAKGMPQAIDALGCAWYYNWGASPLAEDKAIRAEFVPMIWSGRNVDAALASAKLTGATALLGFNEPDGKDQANMTVAQAVALWPKLMATGLRLGSPAPTTGHRWLDDFMSEAKKRNLRVDFLCLHWYGDITKPEAVGTLRRYLQGYWDRYHIPIWLTEYSGADFSYHSRKTTVADNVSFARESAAMMETLPFVERYAWYSSKWSPESKSYSKVGLYDDQAGALTPVGVAYRNAAKH